MVSSLCREAWEHEGPRKPGDLALGEDGISASVQFMNGILHPTLARRMWELRVVNQAVE